ncbi:hypothetical protein SRHO_G00161230 [Serrasalmus rhombeus]
MSLDISAMRSKIVRAVVSEIRTFQKLSALKSLHGCTDDLLALQAKVESLSKEICRLNAKCDDLESRSRRKNIRIVGIPEGETLTLTTSSVSELLKEAFVLDKPPLVDHAHCTLAPKPKSGDPPRPYYGNCVAILRKARRQQRITVSNMKLLVFPDFTAKVARARAAFNEIRTQLRAMEGIQHSLPGTA